MFQKKGATALPVVNQTPASCGRRGKPFLYADARVLRARGKTLAGPPGGGSDGAYTSVFSILQQPGDPLASPHLVQVAWPGWQH